MIQVNDDQHMERCLTCTPEDARAAFLLGPVVFCPLVSAAKKLFSLDEIDDEGAQR
jgi:hypothetical protein